MIALENSFNSVGLDHVMFVRIASAAVTAQMLGCDRNQILNAVSNAWLDGCPLRTYRHASNTGSRKSWAAGDAPSRGLFLVMTAQRGEMGYPTAVTAKGWGFQDVLFGGNELSFGQSYETYVMAKFLFKISFPAEFHALTAVEAALRLTADEYEDAVAVDPRIDILRDKMECVEDERFTREYLEPDKRAIGNAIQAVNAGYKEEKDGYSEEIVQFGACFGTPEFEEGTQAFLNKRKAKF